MTHICIDDFAIKKRQKYGTIMIDIHTHKIIDMIESREQTDVVNWLKKYQNIQVVSRDGSITYKNAIDNAHPTATQVSDRFHLYKNLTGYAADYLRKKLKVIINVVIDEVPLSEVNTSTTTHFIEHNKNLTLAEKYVRLIQLQEQGKNKHKYVKYLI